MNKKIQNWLSSGVSVVAPPTVQATSVVFTTKTDTTITLNWTNGNGASRIVLMRAGGAVNSNPVTNTTYTANSVFGSGSQIGTGNYVVKLGSGPVTVSGLTQFTTYHVSVYEFNGTSTYLTTSPATGNTTTLQTNIAAWLAQGISDGGVSPSQTIINALSTFMTSLDGYGLLTRMKTGNIMHAGSKEFAKLNIKNPATYKYVEVDTVIFSEGNGCKTTLISYFDQPFLANSSGSAVTAVQYVSESNATPSNLVSSHGMKTNTLSSRFFLLRPLSSGANGIALSYDGAGNLFASGTNHRGLYIHGNQAGNSVIYHDGVKDTAVQAVTAPDSTNHRFVLALNTDGVASQFYPYYVALDFLFDTFNDTDAANFKTAFDVYKTAVSLP